MLLKKKKKKEGFKAVVVLCNIETTIKEKHSLSSKNLVKLQRVELVKMSCDFHKGSFLNFLNIKQTC